MPLTVKGKKILQHMKDEYKSDKKGKEVFYASRNAGKITGVDRAGSKTGSKKGRKQ